MTCWLECSPMARETWFQSQVKSYQRLKKWYLMPACLTLSIIMCGSKVKWNNPGKGVAPSPTPRCSSYRKGNLRVTLDYHRPLYFYFICVAKKKKKGRGFENNGVCLDISIDRLRNILKNEPKLIATANNSSGNIKTNIKQTRTRKQEWKEKQLYRYLKRQTSEITYEKKWEFTKLFAQMWHKAIWKGHPMRLELTRVGLLVELANHYTTRGTSHMRRNGHD